MPIGRAIPRSCLLAGSSRNERIARMRNAKIRGRSHLACPDIASLIRATMLVLGDRFVRHCEEQSDEAIQSSFLAFLDCFAEPVIGRRFAPTRWLAMTAARNACYPNAATS